MSVTLHRWAIRQVSTGFYLPAPKGGRRGGTHVEPKDPTADDFEPRLFRTERAANTSLAWWLGGRVFVNYYPGDWGHDDAFEDWKVEEVPGRNEDDMRVVRVKVELT